MGAPGEGYPFGWSIRRWLDGEPAHPDLIEDLPGFAISVAEFLRALRRVDATDGPAAGAHCFSRGAPPAHYDEETRRCLDRLAGHIDTDRAAAVWDAALGATWHGPPVWFHGDVAGGNLLVRDGRLAAVIDFGTCGVGDPARRPGDRVDDALRPEPGGLPRGGRPGPRHLGPSWPPSTER